MDALHTTLVEGDGLAVPPSLREAIGIRPGDTVVVELHGDELRIRSPMSALRRLQDPLSKHNRQGGSVVDELIAERRAEATRE